MGILKVKVMGTGTSQGVPVIGCDCPVCKSTNPHDKRLRTSIYLEYEQTGITVDIGPDFRQQLLQNDIKNLDGVVLTHEHNDHVSGLDDIRPINFLHRKNINVYGLERTLSELKRRFSYVFDTTYDYPGKPRVDLVQIKAGQQFLIGQMPIQALGIQHGPLPILGFRVGNFCYITDAKTIDESQLELLHDLDVLIINALHRRPHFSHLNLDESLRMIEEIAPRQAYLTHLSHDMGLADEVEKELPPNVGLARDNMEILVPM